MGWLSERCSGSFGLFCLKWWADSVFLFYLRKGLLLIWKTPSLFQRANKLVHLLLPSPPSAWQSPQVTLRKKSALRLFQIIGNQGSLMPQVRFSRNEIVSHTK